MSKTFCWFLNEKQNKTDFQCDVRLLDPWTVYIKAVVKTTFVESKIRSRPGQVEMSQDRVQRGS